MRNTPPKTKSRTSFSRRFIPAAFLLPENGKEVWNLWYSKPHRSNGRKSTPLYTRLAVIAIRATACCWMTAKKQNAYSSFLGTVSTAIIFWKQCCRMKRNCTRKFYSKTGKWGNCPHKSYPRIFWIAHIAQERNYYENDEKHKNHWHWPRLRQYEDSQPLLQNRHIRLRQRAAVHSRYAYL